MYSVNTRFKIMLDVSLKNDDDAKKLIDDLL